MSVKRFHQPVCAPAAWEAAPAVQGDAQVGVRVVVQEIAEDAGVPVLADARVVPVPAAAAAKDAAGAAAVPEPARERAMAVQAAVPEAAPAAAIPAQALVSVPAQDSVTPPAQPKRRRRKSQTLG